MLIRHIAPHEVGEIAKLWERMVKEMKPEWTPNTAWWAEMATVLLKTDAYRCFTAVDEITGNLVGFIDGFIYPEPSTGKLHAVGQHLYVLPEFRGTSAAGRLYKEAVRTGKKAGAAVFEFFCFYTEQSLWAKKGYKPMRTMMRRTYV